MDEEQSQIHKVGEKPNLSSTKSSEDKHTFNIPSSGVYTNHRGGGSKPLLISLGVVVIFLIAGTAFLLRGNFTTPTPPSPTPVPTMETPVVETTPTPTPQALDRSTYTVRVLNGTKTAGLAASTSAKLKGLGYTTEKTGNATNSAFINTVVRVKANATELMNQIIKDLAPEYTGVGETSLKDSEKVDAEIILGTK